MVVFPILVRMSLDPQKGQGFKRPVFGWILLAMNEIIGHPSNERQLEISIAFRVADSFLRLANCSPSAHHSLRVLPSPFLEGAKEKHEAYSSSLGNPGGF